LHPLAAAAVAESVAEQSDDGLGIPQDVQLGIFEQFFTTKAIGEGSGLAVPFFLSILYIF
jgi:signal transduction histidine kinase